MREFTIYSLWNYVSLLAAQGPSLILPTIVVTIRGGSEAAGYYIAWTLFSVLTLIRARCNGHC